MYRVITRLNLVNWFNEIFMGVKFQINNKSLMQCKAIYIYYTNCFILRVIFYQRV